MRVVIPQTGDPWMDIGIVALYYDLIEIDDELELFHELELTTGFLLFDVDKEHIKKLQEELDKRMVSKLNEILLPPIELKLLDDDTWQKKKEGKFYNERYQQTLTPQEIEQLKAGKTNDGFTFKPFSNPQKQVEMATMRNYIGLKGDWKRITETYAEEIQDFFEQWTEQVKKPKACPLCGRPANPKKFRPMNQSRNVLFNQHHAVAVRGYASNVTKENMCPTCNLLNLYATVQVNWHPYFVSSDQVTHLIIPRVNNLEALYEVMNVLSKEFIQLQSERNVTSYRTNIKELRHRTLYATLLQIYYWLNSVREEAEKTINELSETSKRAVEGWLVARYTKGQNVIFRDFSYIDTDADLFRLTDQVRYGKDQDFEGNVVPDFFHQLKAFSPYLIDDLAEAIVKKNLQQLANGLFLLYKNALRDPEKNGLTQKGCKFFRDYISYFCSYFDSEVKPMLSEQLQKDLRSLGGVIGQLDDIAVLTKINTAPTCESFVKALKDALFKIYKDIHKSTKDQITQEEAYNIGLQRMESILSQLNEQNLPVIRDTLMIYISLSAFHTHNNRKKQEQKGSNQE